MLAEPETPVPVTEGVAPGVHQPLPLRLPLTEGGCPDDGLRTTVATTLEAPDAGTSPRARMVTRRRKTGRVACRIESPSWWDRL